MASILESIPEPMRSFNLCVEALLTSEESFPFIPEDIRPHVMANVVCMDGCAIKNIPPAHRTQALWLASLSSSCGESICYMLDSEKTEDYWLVAFEYGLLNPTHYITRDWFIGSVREYLLTNADTADILYMYTELGGFTEAETIASFINTDMCERYMEEGFSICMESADYEVSLTNILSLIEAKCPEVWVAIQLGAPVSTIRNVFHTSYTEDATTNSASLPDNLM